ncbi:MAG: MFS transporter [Promethearchaeota archaeon]
MKASKALFELNRKDLSVSKISLVSSVFFASIAGYAYFAFLPVYLDAKGFPVEEIIFILMWMGVGIAIFSWSFGRVSDRSGRRKQFFKLGLFFQIVILALIPLNSHIIYLCFLNFLRGFLSGMRMPASDALFADIVEKKDKREENYINRGTYEISGTQISLLSTTKSSGWAIGVLISSSIVAIFGVGSLILFLIIVSGMSLCFALPVQDVKKEDLINVDIPFENQLGDRHEKKRTRSSVKFLLFISVFCRQFGLIPFIQMIAILLATARIPIGLTGVVIALNPIFQAIAMVIMGRIIDKPKISEKIMLAIGFGLSAFTLILYAVGMATGSITIFIIAQISLGFSWGCIYTGALKYIVNRAPRDRAFYMGIWMTDLQIAKIISYLAFTFLWVIATPAMVLPYAVIAPIIGIFLVLWL